MIPQNLHLPNTYYETFLRLKFPTYFHFLNRPIGGKKEKGNERKERKGKFKSKRPSTYISFNQTLTEPLRCPWP